MLRTLTHITAAAALLAATSTQLNAQVFVAPNAVEYVFGDPHVTPAQNTSCYSLRAGYAYFPDMAPVLGSAYADLYVAGWNSKDIGGRHEVTVLLTEPSNPTNVLWKASIPYTGIQDLQVGSLRNPTTNNTEILVAYYQVGVGHMLDVYKLNPSVPSLASHTTLSHAPTYGRISMDFHATYDCAIAWVNTEAGPNKGIQAKVYINNTWSGVSTLSGTANKAGVDIAITQINGPVSAYPLHFVYSGGGFVTESSVDMSTLALAPGTIAPTVNDNHYAGAGLASRLVLDCPDFSTSTVVANPSAWAYTYSDGINVIVRNRNATLGGVNMSIVTSGMLGNSALDPVGGVYQVFSPAINYGQGYPNGSPEEIMVTWYATDGAGDNGYMALRMNANGTAITSTPDYLKLPNANTASIPSNFSSGIALSKTGPKSVGDFLYATYYDIDPVTGLYQLHHAFHKWSDVVFKGEGATGTSGSAAMEATTFSAYPNPFSDKLNTFVTLAEDGVLQLELHDMAGRLVGQYNAPLTKGGHDVAIENAKKLTAGSYMLTATVNGKKIDTKMVVKR
ncbi:T9SS type A sorting domain-containing protein [Taibaiella koreensis]|uniref:T9SS type A sorting domain-containing protein n=1 Tax=Taibaiella koreensis TaxID=1268548 RepID=UPI0013C36C17|nr:T9SS type A sorting domain-containing protein [Taibaiella koreensis]